MNKLKTKEMQRVPLCYLPFSTGQHNGRKKLNKKNQSIPAPSHQQEPTPFQGSDNPNSHPTPK
jgi:hypothetical protein